MAAMNYRVVTVFGGTGFLAAALSGISVTASTPSGLHQDIRNGEKSCLVLMIRDYSQSTPTFTMSGRSPMHLLALTVW